MPGIGKLDGTAVALVFLQPIFGIGAGSGFRAAAAQIPERAEARNHLGIDRLARRLLFAFIKRLQPGLQIECDRTLRFIAILRLTRIGWQIVQLRLGRFDVFVSSYANTAEGTARKVVPGIHALRIHWLAFARMWTEQPNKTVPLKLRRRRDIQKIQDSRSQVEKACRLVYTRRVLRSSTRPAQNQRHPQRAFVDEIAMGLLSVLAQALAVIGSEDDQGVLKQFSSCQRFLK